MCVSVSVSVSETRGCSGLALDVPPQLLGLVPQVGSAVRLQRRQGALQLLPALRGHAVPLLALCQCRAHTDAHTRTRARATQIQVFQSAMLRENECTNPRVCTLKAGQIFRKQILFKIHFLRKTKTHSCQTHELCLRAAFESIKSLRYLSSMHVPFVFID